jgi:hypothetical protein
MRMSAFDTEEETSVTWLWVDVPLCVLFFLAVSGIPLWMVIRHPDTGPDRDGNGGQHKGLAQSLSGSPQPSRNLSPARTPQPARHPQSARRAQPGLISES